MYGGWDCVWGGWENYFFIVYFYMKKVLNLIINNSINVIEFKNMKLHFDNEHIYFKILINRDCKGEGLQIDKCFKHRIDCYMY